ncbi:MAG: Gfo/Idh/MocA family oxidoreductase [Actinobacteria bacterium]|nr:Gfo/Idh/MocA family oxidoreductase [Actinomycetota bacterium]
MTIGWGFIGAGWIAQRAMAPAVHAAGNARVQAVASRDEARSAMLEPQTVHASYADLIDDPLVDVVYVCLANHQHEEWVTRALAAGKHVLCEKPLALDAEQARRMLDAASDADRILVEAVWCRWHPRFRRLADLARGGHLGELASIDSGFTFPGEIEGNYRSDPEQGGGALLDVGGYQVHAWVALAGRAANARVERVERVERVLGPTGVDLTTKVSAVLGGGTRATAVASFVMPEHQFLVVTGTEAVARMATGAAFTTWREPSTLIVGEHEEAFAPVDAYQLMVESMSDRVAGGGGWTVPIDESLGVAWALDLVRSTG